jgi:tRNA uridine 5-carboxymethylaminomethyl modification enzyme
MLPRQALQQIAGEAAALVIEGGRVAGVDLADGSRLTAPATILCTGTFLGGKLFRGEEEIIGAASARRRPTVWQRKCAKACRWRG